jgi:hypothetical protein
MTCYLPTVTLKAILQIRVQKVYISYTKKELGKWGIGATTGGFRQLTAVFVYGHFVPAHAMRAYDEVEIAQPIRNLGNRWR